MTLLDRTTLILYIYIRHIYIRELYRISSFFFDMMRHMRKEEDTEYHLQFSSAEFPIHLELIRAFSFFFRATPS